jgi:glycosyltransferase involved in cell wall biosynthesis
LSEVLRNEGLRSRMGRAARLRAEEHFDLRRQSAALVRVYNKVMQNSSGGLP